MKTEICKLEQKYWDAMADHDYEAVRDLARFLCLVTGTRGVMSVDEHPTKLCLRKGWKKHEGERHLRRTD